MRQEPLFVPKRAFARQTPARHCRRRRPDIASIFASTFFERHLKVFLTIGTRLLTLTATSVREKGLGVSWLQLILVVMVAIVAAMSPQIQIKPKTLIQVRIDAPCLRAPISAGELMSATGSRPEGRKCTCGLTRQSASEPFFLLPHSGRRKL